MNQTGRPPVDKPQEEKMSLKDLKTKLILGTLKYTTWVFNIIIIMLILYGILSYVLFIMESAH
jgi:hypothetical protein